MFAAGALLGALGCSSRGNGGFGETDAGSDVAVVDGTIIDTPVVDTPVVDAGPTDAGREAVDVADAPPGVDRPAEDVPPVDAGGPARDPQPLYGPCASDAECVAGLRCRTAAVAGFSNGQCNRECTSDDVCVLLGLSPVDGHCQAADREGRRYCARVCANGIDCEREGYTCLGINQGRPNAVNICVPVCTATSCGDGTTCDPQAGRCRPVGAPPLTGRTLGQSCVPNTDPTMTPATVCQSGLCSPQVGRDAAGNPVQSGSNGGYCFSRCILPRGYSTADIWTGTELPRGTCPEGGVCFPARTLAEGDVGNCFPGCTSDSECRSSEGYACHRSFRVSATRTRTFVRGFCAPFDCAAADARVCPDGYMCRRTTSGTTTTGSCVPVGT